MRRYSNFRTSAERAATLMALAWAVTAGASLSVSAAGTADVVRVEGVVLEAFPDAVGTRRDQLVVGRPSGPVRVIVPCCPANPLLPENLIGSKISATGREVMLDPARSAVSVPLVRVAEYSDVVVVEPLSQTPFEAPAFGEGWPTGRMEDVRLELRRVCGRVLATWEGRRFLLRTAKGVPVEVSVRYESGVPPIDSAVEVSGYPAGRSWYPLFTHAVYRSLPDSGQADDVPTDVALDRLRQEDGTFAWQNLHGRLLRLRGVVRSESVSVRGHRRLNLESGGVMLSVDPGESFSAFGGIGSGDRVEVTGIGRIGLDRESVEDAVPWADVVTVVLRRPEDLRVVSRAPWWTPVRLLVVIGVLLCAMVAILVWNRILNRLVERRSRALLRERLIAGEARLKVEERTHLAVELHDALSQDIAGLSLQLDAAGSACGKVSAEETLRLIETARRTLRRCGENLRNCLWDLRSRSFEERTLEDALRKTLSPHLTPDVALEIVGETRRDRLSDSAVHGALCIVRELAVNAVRHGQARKIVVRTELADGLLSLSVEDDGTGFDPATRAGVAEGHFGLRGVSERVVRFGGRLEIESAPGAGTRIRAEGLKVEEV